MLLQVGLWAAALVLFVAILWLVVMVHEIGHFVTARLARIRVLEFGLGYPPRARVLRSHGDTLYTLNWLPIGGFVLMEGEERDSADEHSFTNAGLPRQTLVLVAGVAMNVVLAFVLFFLVAWLANPIAGIKFEAVEAGSPAAQAGLHGGDVIESVDGRRYGWMVENDVLAAIQSHAGETVTLGIADPSGGHRTVTARLRSAAEIAALKAADGRDHGSLGISSPGGLESVFVYVQTDPVTAAGTAASQTGAALGMIVRSLGDLASSVVAHPTSAPPAAGPIGIADQVHSSLVDRGPVFVVILAALLSANLALFNILPFPPLDGGKILVLVVKRIAGVRGVGRIEQFTYVAGFMLLIGLVVWVSWFDIVRGLFG